MGQHTELPWVASRTQINAGVNVDTIAKVTGADFETACANTRLMAAAPELLAALEFVQDCLIKCLTGGEVSAKHAGKAIEQAALVIARARGDQ